MAELDEGTLVAFVDGELDPAAAREVARRLAEDPAAQEKVWRLRRSASLVRAAFSQPGWERVPSRLSRLVAGPPRALAGRRRFAAAVAATIAACAVGFAGGLGIRAALRPGASSDPDPAARLMDEVAEYHTVFARESHGLGIVPARSAPLIETWFADVLGRKLAVPDLRAFGLAFRGARLLVVDGDPVPQFLYGVSNPPPAAASPVHNHPFGICVTLWPDANRTLSIARRDGVTLALWAQGGYAYVLVGWMNAARLSRIAAAIRPALEAA